MKAVLLEFVGNRRSGKTTLATHLVKTRGFHTVNGTDILRTYAKADGVSLKTPEDFDVYNKQVRHKYGMAFMARMAIGLHAPNLAFDGVFNIYDFFRFREAGGITIALACPLVERHRRDIELGGTKSLDDFKADEKPWYNNPDPAGSHILEIMEQADYTIHTREAKSVVLAQLDRIVEEQQKSTHPVA